MRYDNELKFIYLIREQNLSFRKYNLSISTLCCNAYHIDDIMMTKNVKQNINS